MASHVGLGGAFLNERGLGAVVLLLRVVALAVDADEGAVFVELG